MKTLFAALLLLCPVTVFGRGAVSGNCEQGGHPVITGTLTSTTKVQQSYPQCFVTVYYTGGGNGTVSTSGTAVTLVDGKTFGGWGNVTIAINSVNYTVAFVSSPTTLTLTTSAGNQTSVLYQTQSLAPAPIYIDNSGTPLANPFQADTNGRWQFFADDGTYDARFSGGGIPSPFTWTALSITDPFGTSGNLQPISCFITSTCVIQKAGSLIWTNPAIVPEGVATGLKINVSNNIGATPGAGNAVALTVRQTNDPPLAGGPGLISSSLWGADIISQQGTQTYVGPVSIVVVSGTATATTTGAHNLNALTGYTPDFVTFTGTGNSILNGTVWTVATVPTTSTFTFGSLAVPNGSYTGTMITATTNRVIEAEIQSACVTANIQLDAFNGTGCRANGIEIIALAGSQLLTTALTTNTNSSSSVDYWNNGIELARIKGVGIEFRELDTPGSAFKIASMWDLSFSPTVLKVTGIHTTILDVSDLSGSLTNLINLGSAGPTNFVLGAGQPINFTNLKMSVVGPAASGAGNEALSVNANGAVFGVRHSSTAGLDLGVFTGDNLNVLTGTGLFFPALGVNPGGNQPVCINSTTKRVYEGTGGGC